MNVALCLIARLENKYIREYVEYYNKLGFDKILIYDNNRPNEEKFTDELQDYVESGFVDVIEWPIFDGDAQRPAYQDCYDKYKSEYDWIAFFDADEYFVPCNCNNIKDFLKNDLYENFQGVAIPMINYDDNDIIINNSNTRLDKYTRRLKWNYRRFWKTIVKCGSYSINFLSEKYKGEHLPYIENGKICDADGYEVKYGNISCDYVNIKNAYLKHIPTGCIDDFINGKALRGWPHLDNIKLKIDFDLRYFSFYNKLTQEKKDYYNKNKKK